MLPALLTTVLFAISAVCAGRTTKLLGGTEANFWRITLATLLLGLWAHLFGQGLSGRAFPFFLLSGFVGFGVGDLALYQAYPRLGSRLCMILVHCVAAPFGAIIEWLWLGTQITLPQIICGTVILTGVAIALAPDHRVHLSRGALVPGVLFGLVAGCGQGFGAVLSRKAYAVAEQAGQMILGVNQGITAAYQRIIAGWAIGTLFYLVLKYVQRRNDATNPSQNRGPTHPGSLRSKWQLAGPWVIANALAGPAIGVSCFQWALASESTAVVLPIVAVTPLVVIPFARVTEGDRPGLRSIFGAVIAVAGVAVLTWMRLRG